MYLLYIAGPFYFQSKNYPNYYFGSDNGAAQYNIIKERGTKFNLVPGLTGQPGTVSFESADKPRFFLRHINYFIRLEKQKGSKTDIFAKDATFKMIKNKYFSGFESFESTNFPGYFIRHQSYSLKISKAINTDLFKNDASFKKTHPNVIGNI